MGNASEENYCSIIRAQIETLNEYLKTKNTNLNTIRVLENVGDYSYILKFPQFNEYDVTLTIQVPVNKSLVDSNVVLSLPKNHEDKTKIEETITNYFKQSNEQLSQYDLLKDFYTKSINLIDENLKKISVKDDSKAKVKRKKSPTQPKSDDSNENTKKSSMKTSADVVHRIQWDSEINKEHIAVGYLDRFLGIKECSFNTFDWGDIVLADIGALAIPQHRINYFKYKNEIIWDKNQRIDNVYGSTGSNVTIYDVIKRLENVKFEQKDGENEDDDELASIKQTKAQEQPNYFLSIPIDSREIKANFQQLKEDLIDYESDIQDIILPDTSLHITVCTLRIDNENELHEAIQALDSIKGLDEFLPIKLNFKSLGNFYDKVLYVKSECDLDKIRSLRNAILESLKKANVNLAGNYYDFVPHLTIAKISGKNSNSKLKSINSLVDAFIVKKYENFNFGEQCISELHLCKMVNILKCLTYPVEYTLQLENEL